MLWLTMVLKSPKEGPSVLKCRGTTSPEVKIQRLPGDAETCTSCYSIGPAGPILVGQFKLWRYVDGLLNLFFACALFLRAVASYYQSLENVDRTQLPFLRLP